MFIHSLGAYKGRLSQHQKVSHSSASFSIRSPQPALSLIMPKLGLSAVLAALVLSAQQAAAGLIAGPALTCKTISDTVSSASSIVYPLQALTFSNDIDHWFLSSKQVPTCVLEVGSPGDLSIAMKIIGDTRTPFALMSGGHSSNPGFSSTTGVHISFKKMDQVVFSTDKSTIEIGAGRVSHIHPSSYATSH